MNRAFWQFLRDAPVQSGVCMCGGDVGTCTDHGSVDMWDPSLRSWLEAEEQLAEQVAAALVRLSAVENNAALEQKWAALLAAVRG